MGTNVASVTNLKTPRRETKLADGTNLRDLINLQTREVQMRVLADAEIHELEMERIFGKTWLLLGHETEIPEIGDFVVRDMGADQVIVARDRDNKVYVSLNVCPHRGMRVCTTEAGNSNIHKCIYHGWAFKPNGDFLGAPVAKEKMHGDILCKEELGLQKARVQLYGGLIFATWNHEGESFDEFLGDMKWYYDMLFCRTDSGLEVLGPPQRFIVPANWKAAAEQSAADGFHTITLHQWLGEFGGMNEGEIVRSMYGVEVGSLKGHALRCMPVTGKFAKQAEGFDKMTIEQKLEIIPPPGVSKNMLPQLKNHLTPEQLELLVDQPPQVGGMFPNVLVAFIYAPQPNGEIMGVTSLHTYVPRGPDKLEFTNWIFVEKDAPAEYKERVRSIAIGMLGTSGMVEQDDSDTWPHQSRNAKGPQGRNVTMKYQAICTTPKPASWPGPALVYDGFTKDDTQWNWWLRWNELMNGPE